MIYAIIVASTIAILWIISYVPLIDDIFAIKAQAQLYIDADDQGGGFVSLVSTKIKNRNYAEILGSMPSKNLPAGIDTDLKSTLKEIKAEVEIFENNELEWNYGEVAGYIVTADIALPGLRKGEAKVS